MLLLLLLLLLLPPLPPPPPPPPLPMLVYEFNTWTPWLSPSQNWSAVSKWSLLSSVCPLAPGQNSKKNDDLLSIAWLDQFWPPSQNSWSAKYIRWCAFSMMPLRIIQSLLELCCDELSRHKYGAILVSVLCFHPCSNAPSTLLVFLPEITVCSSWHWRATHLHYGLCW